MQVHMQKCIYEYMKIRMGVGMYVLRYGCMHEYMKYDFGYVKC